MIPECQGQNHAMCSLFRLALADVHLRFLHVFPWLIAHFFLVLSNPLSGWITVYFSVHLLKDILVISKFGQL